MDFGLVKEGSRFLRIEGIWSAYEDAEDTLRYVADQVCAKCILMSYIVRMLASQEAPFLCEAALCLHSLLLPAAVV